MIVHDCWLSESAESRGTNSAAGVLFGAQHRWWRLIIPWLDDRRRKLSNFSSATTPGVSADESTLGGRTLR